MSNVTSTAPVTRIKLVGADGGGGIDNNALASAADRWTSGCSGYDNPAFLMSGTADMTVQVNFMSGRNDGRVPNCDDSCGCAKLSVSSGKIIGAMVYVFQQEPTGADCTASYASVLTHELGHVLGLDDAPDPSCDGQIMGGVGGAIGAGECTVVDNNFRTEFENQGPGPDPDPVHCL